MEWDSLLPERAAKSNFPVAIGSGGFVPPSVAYPKRNVIITIIRPLLFYYYYYYY